MGSSRPACWAQGDDQAHPPPADQAPGPDRGISRGSVYYGNEPSSDAGLKLMRRIDELHLELPLAGARMLRDLLRAEGFAAGRKHMTTLMRRRGITALDGKGCWRDNVFIAAAKPSRSALNRSLPPS